MSKLDDDVGSSLVTSLLSVAGDEYGYWRGNQGRTVTAAKSIIRAEAADSQGVVVVTELADFKLATSDLTEFGDPQPGDRFEEVCGSDLHTWRVEPPPGEKCFYIQSPQMIRIHTVKVL